MSRNIFDRSDQPEETVELTGSELQAPEEGSPETLEQEIRELEYILRVKKARWLELKRRGASGQEG